MNKRITEAELFKPALKLIAKYPQGITTSSLIKELMKAMKPAGEDIHYLRNRNDVKFTQKVRNLISHRYSNTSIIKNGYVEYTYAQPSGTLKITQRGTDFIGESWQVAKAEYLFEIKKHLGNGVPKCYNKYL